MAAMTRIALAALFGTALLAAPAAAAPMPRPDVTVSGPTIRLGDLFSDAGPHAGDAVAVAPAAGLRVTYNADWLAAVAREHDLDWSPASPFDQVTVERASRLLGTAAITRQILAALAKRQPISDAELKLDAPGLRLAVPAEAPDTIAIDGLTLDPQTGWVSAFVTAPAGDPAAPRRRISGRLVYMSRIAVLDRAMAPGEVIAAADLGSLRMERDRLPPDAVTDADQLLGKTPRRPLRPDEPILGSDIQMPILVHKGDLVTILLRTPMLQLTAQAKALEDGAKGSAIRVQNSKSDRIVDAVVVDIGMVTVAAPPAAGVVAMKAEP